MNAKIINACIFLSLIVTLTITAQQAQTYFPNDSGYVWNFKVTPLDTSNNPIDSLAYLRRDSFAVKLNYQSKFANLVLSKTGTNSSIGSTPYTDSSFLHFESTNGWSYLKIMPELDSIPFLDSIGLVGFIKSLQGWYSYYRFTQTINVQYTIFSKDTSITYSGTTYPLRFKLTGKRFNDQNIFIPAGTFLCKKFVTNQSINLLVQILPPPFPPAEVPLIQILDTSWIASGIWKVKTFIPTTKVDLSLIGMESFFIPGQITELMQHGPTDVRLISDLPIGFNLEQNYPNPFNPLTIINYQLPRADWVTLRVYDILGREIAILIDDWKEAGKHKIEWDGRKQSGGVYFYSLQIKTDSQTKKLVLLK